MGDMDQAKGRVKEAAGDLTGDPRLEREGKVDQAAGQVKQKVETVAAAMKEKAGQAAGKVKEQLGRS